MIGFFRKFVKRQDGAVLAYTAILLPVFIGFIALGLDIASWHIDKRRTQTMADSAAVAGALEHFRNVEEESGDPDNCSSGPSIFNAAKEAAERNNFDTGLGQTLTINCPPLSGAELGNEMAVEAIVTTPLPLILSALLTTSDKTAASRAVATAGIGEGCLYALNPSESGTITVTGTADVIFGCGVIANSSDSSAITINGAACLTATMISAAGGVSGNCISPAPVVKVSQADPLGSMPEPEVSGCDFTSRTQISGHNDATLSPGVYCNDINITTNGTVTFEPGIYILDGAGLNIGAQATVVGDNVMFYMVNTSSANNFSIAGDASVTFTAPDSGMYQGIFFFESRNESGVNHSFTGGSSMDIDGIIYAPNGDISYTGGSSSVDANTFIIADTITFTGNSFMSNTDPEGNLITFNPFLIKSRLVE